MLTTSDTVHSPPDTIPLTHNTMLTTSETVHSPPDTIPLTHNTMLTTSDTVHSPPDALHPASYSTHSFMMKCRNSLV